MGEKNLIINTIELQTKARRFFRDLAAGAPLSNCKWGKSEREIRDYYLLAAQAIENMSAADPEKEKTL